VTLVARHGASLTSGSTARPTRTRSSQLPLSPSATAWRRQRRRIASGLAAETLAAEVAGHAAARAAEAARGGIRRAHDNLE
jgi:hypothetical protein